MAKKIPDGYHTITPHLTIRNAAEAVEFYKKAFGAEVLAQMPAPDGKLMHAEIKIGDSVVMIADEYPQMGNVSPQTLGGSASSLMLYVNDADKTFEQAVKAGAKATMPVQEMFWGDRYGQLVDPFGHKWAVATHVKDVSPQEMAEAAKKAFGA